MSRLPSIVFLSATMYVELLVAPALAEAAPRYEAVVLAATRQVVLRDFDAAIASLRELATREGSRPEAFCALGEAQLVRGTLDEARAAYESCARFAGSAPENHPLTVALVGLARVLEREDKPKQERDAWQRVLATAATSKEPAAVSLAQARLLLLDAKLAQASAWDQVRARIAERAELKAKEAAAKP